MTAQTKCRISNDRKSVEACDTLLAVTVDPHRKGVVVWNFVNMDTMDHSRTFYGIKSGRHEKRGIAMNFCPFCGENISAPFVKEEPINDAP